MTRLPTATLLALFTCATACTDGGAPDYCRDHRLFHADHAGSAAILTIDLSADGRFQRLLQLPDGSTTQDIDEQMFDLQLEEGQLRQINVQIFEQMPELDEVVVTMTTAATQKRFAISRQCENPIFRLD